MPYRARSDGTVDGATAEFESDDATEKMRERLVEHHQATAAREPPQRFVRRTIYQTQPAQRNARGWRGKRG
jgi:hypothetical protein